MRPTRLAAIDPGTNLGRLQVNALASSVSEVSLHDGSA
jgi:hypothetical protein